MSEGASGLTRSEAICALRQSDLPAIHRVLVYAEGAALVANGVGVSMGAPHRLLKKLFDDTLRGALCWRARDITFPQHLVKATRHEVDSTLFLHGRTRGVAGRPWAARLAKEQVGDLRGVAELAHFCGLMGDSVRANDDETLRCALQLTDYVRKRLLEVVGDPDDEHTPALSTSAALAEPEEQSN